MGFFAFFPASDPFACRLVSFVLVSGSGLSLLGGRFSLPKSSESGKEDCDRALSMRSAFSRHPPMSTLLLTSHRFSFPVETFSSSSLASAEALALTFGARMGKPWSTH